MLENLETLKIEYYKKHGIKPNVLLLGRDDFSSLLKNKKEFKSVTILEDFDKIDDLTILQVHKLKMFQVGLMGI